MQFSAIQCSNYGFLYRYLYRPYGRVDRTKLKTKLLQRCVEHGGHLQLVHQTAFDLLVTTASHQQHSISFVTLQVLHSMKVKLQVFSMLMAAPP